jgi:hypothetical protein
MQGGGELSSYLYICLMMIQMMIFRNPGLEHDLPERQIIMGGDNAARTLNGVDEILMKEFEERGLIHDGVFGLEQQLEVIIDDNDVEGKTIIRHDIIIY